MSKKEQLTSDIIKDNVARIMYKIDTQIPLYVKMHSDLYREYIRVVEDFFEAGNTLENAKVNTLLKDQLSKNIIEHNIRIYSNTALLGLSVYGEYLKWYSDLRLVGMKSLDQSIHNYMNMIGMPIKRSASDTPKNTAPSTNTKKQPRRQQTRRRSA